MVDSVPDAPHSRRRQPEPLTRSRRPLPPSWLERGSLALLAAALIIWNGPSAMGPTAEPAPRTGSREASRGPEETVGPTATAPLQNETASPTSIASASPSATEEPERQTPELTPAPNTPPPATAVPAPRPTAAPTSAPPPAAVTGVWIGASELRTLPMAGAAWDRVVDAASDAGTGADVSDQDSNHDQATLAAAIYTARTGEARERAVAALESAIGTERGGRWLAVGRNLLGYVIAADLLGIRSGPVYDWLASFRTLRLEHNNSGDLITFRQSAWSSGSNASAQEGAAYAALAVYLGDGEMLSWSWNAFRRYAGDRSSPHAMTSNSDAWQQVPADPVGIQNSGASRNGCSIDGAISNDMSRGSSDVCDPGYTQYPWVGLEGAVPAALILARAGYPAWDVQGQALRRAAVYLMGLRQSSGNNDWYDDSRADEIKHLLNRQYGLGYPGQHPVGPGRTVGFTDFTHP